MELSELIGSAPVQYGSIKAIALSEMGRFDLVEAAIDEEVTDDDHPFGQGIASLARSVYLTRLAAWGPAAESLAETLDWAERLSRVWMQYWAGSLMAVVSAHCRLQSDGAVPDADSLPSFGQWNSGLTGAQLALLDGSADRAAELAQQALPDPLDETPTADHARAFDLLAQAQLALGDLDGAADAAARGLELAEPMEFGAVLWRLWRVRELALEALGRDDEAQDAATRARSTFGALAGPIADVELRAWFERQPLAPVD